MKTPQTKSELEAALLACWAMPAHYGEAYRRYAMGDDAGLVNYLNWLMR